MGFGAADAFAFNQVSAPPAVSGLFPETLYSYAILEAMD